MCFGSWGSASRGTWVPLSGGGAEVLEGILSLLSRHRPPAALVGWGLPLPPFSPPPVRFGGVFELWIHIRQASLETKGYRNLFRSCSGASALHVGADGGMLHLILASPNSHEQTEIHP
jgi:hypothetical protein